MLTFIRWMISCPGRIFLGPCFPKSIFGGYILWVHVNISLPELLDDIVVLKPLSDEIQGLNMSDLSPSLDISAFVIIPKILWYM